MKKLFVIAAWNIALIVALLAVFEFILRFTPFNDVRNPAAASPPGYYVADAKLGVQIQPNQPVGRFTYRGPGHETFSNELGCFDKPSKLEPGEPYILAIGDSFTWGYNPLESKWTSIVEHQTGTRVLKCGVPGTGSKYQLQLLKSLLKRLPYPPTAIVHLYDTTDFNDDFVFPGDAVVQGQRVQSFGKIRLSDGRKIAHSAMSGENRRGQIYGQHVPTSRSPLVLPALIKVALTLDSRIKKRRFILEGKKPEFLHWRYEFNLLLLDPKEYPLVAKKLDEHLATLNEFRATALEAGASYHLFHTNSFRLPATRPLVQRLETFFREMPEFMGYMPELDRHMFDPHWRAESEAVVAAEMLRLIRAHDLREQEKRISHRNNQRNAN